MLYILYLGILYLLNRLCGYPPFYDDDNFVLFEKIKSGKFDYPEASWGKISDDAKFIVNNLLVVDPKKRMTLDELLKHPWILGVTTEKKQGNVLEKMREWNSKRKIQ